MESLYMANLQKEEHDILSIGQVCLMTHNMQHHLFARHQGVVIMCKLGII